MKKFSQQSDAIAHYNCLTAQADGEHNVLVAADIKPNEAYKCFWAGKLSDFWAKYHIGGAQRCHYEILLPENPSKYYIDVDLSLESAGADFNGDKALAEIIRLVRGLFQRLLNIPVDDDAVTVVHLDSSNHKKFSRHLVFDLGAGRAFTSVADCGAFTRHLEKELLELYGDPPQNRFWYRRTSPPDQDHYECIIDPAVYTKNRNFRMVFSSKLAQNRYLCDFQTPPEHPSRSSNSITLGPEHHRLFLRSLIQYFELSPHQLFRVNEPNGEMALFTSSSWYDMNRKMQSHRYNCTGVATRALSEFGKVAKPTGSLDRIAEGRLVRRARELSTISISEPDEWTQTQVPGVVLEYAKWLVSQLNADSGSEKGFETDYIIWKPQRMSCTVQFKGRYCPIAKRVHSSNHPMIHIDFDQHLHTPTYRYACHSRGCKYGKPTLPSCKVPSEVEARIRTLQNSFAASQQRQFSTFLACLL